MGKRLRKLLAGERYGERVVIAQAEPGAHGIQRVHARCQCGVESVVVASMLVRRRADSCKSCAHAKRNDQRGPMALLSCFSDHDTWESSCLEHRVRTQRSGRPKLVSRPRFTEAEAAQDRIDEAEEMSWLGMGLR